MDTEFIEDGKTIDLVSIGIVAEDGREYYAQSCEFNPKKASPWVRDNVLPHLTICPWANATVDVRHPYINDIHYHKRHGQCVDQHRGLIHNCPWRSREQLKRDILSFMNIEHYGEPELWAYYADYDHVALCQIFGTMMQLPQGFPMYTMDLKQWCKMLGDPRLPEQGKDEHNALEDAKYNRTAYLFLRDREEGQKHAASVDTDTRPTT